MTTPTTPSAAEQNARLIDNLRKRGDEYRRAFPTRTYSGGRGDGRTPGVAYGTDPKCTLADTDVRDVSYEDADGTVDWDTGTVTWEKPPTLAAGTVSVAAIDHVADEYLAMHPGHVVANEYPSPVSGRTGFSTLADIAEELALRRAIADTEETADMIQARPVSRNRDLVKSTVREEARAAQRRHDRKSDPVPAPTPGGSWDVTQGDYFHVTDTAAVLVSWRARTGERKTAGARASAAVRRSCGHDNPIMSKIDGRWTCKRCRTRWTSTLSRARAASPAALETLASWDADTAASILASIAREDADAAARERIAALHRDMSAARDGRSELLDA